MFEVMLYLKLQSNLNSHLELLLLEVKVQNRFSIQLEEKKKNDPKSQQCIIKLMEHLALVSKNTEIMFGLFHKLNIDLDMLRKKSLKELVFLYIQKE